MADLIDLEPQHGGFGRTEKARRRAQKLIVVMRHRYGDGPPGARCGSCTHLRKYHQSKTWFKCLRYGETMSAATDWRVSWPACALYEQERP